MRTALLIVALVGLVGCQSVVHRSNGTWDVPRQVQTISPPGTNQAAMFIDNCKTEVHHAFGSNEYLNCVPITNYHFASSPGQLGQYIMGAFIGTGLGVGGALSGGSSATASQTNSNNAAFFDGIPPNGGHALVK